MRLFLSIGLCLISFSRSAMGALADLRAGRVADLHLGPLLLPGSDRTVGLVDPTHSINERNSIVRFLLAEGYNVDVYRPEDPVSDTRSVIVAIEAYKMVKRASLGKSAALTLKQASTALKSCQVARNGIEDVAELKGGIRPMILSNHVAELDRKFLELPKGASSDDREALLSSAAFVTFKMGLKEHIKSNGKSSTKDKSATKEGAPSDGGRAAPSEKKMLKGTQKVTGTPETTTVKKSGSFFSLSFLSRSKGSNSPKAPIAKSESAASIDSTVSSLPVPAEQVWLLDSCEPIHVIEAMTSAIAASRSGSGVSSGVVAFPFLVTDDSVVESKADGDMASETGSKISEAGNKVSQAANNAPQAVNKIPEIVKSRFGLAFIDLRSGVPPPRTARFAVVTPEKDNPISGSAAAEPDVATVPREQTSLAIVSGSQAEAGTRNFHSHDDPEDGNVGLDMDENPGEGSSEGRTVSASTSRPSTNTAVSAEPTSSRSPVPGVSSSSRLLSSVDAPSNASLRRTAPSAASGPDSVESNKVKDLSKASGSFRSSDSLARQGSSDKGTPPAAVAQSSAVAPQPGTNVIAAAARKENDDAFEIWLIHHAGLLVVLLGSVLALLG